MSINLILAQSSKELEFILKNDLSNNTFCLPLNLETQLYCINRGVKYIDLKSYLDNSFHLEALKTTDKFLEELNIETLNYQCEKQALISLIRFKINSILFLIFSIKKISSKVKIEKIYISGWNDYQGQYSKKNYFISYLVVNLFENYKIENISKNKISNIAWKSYNDYKISQKNLSNKKTIVLNNMGYNFSKIAYQAVSQGYKILVLDDNGISLLKKFFFKIMGINFLKTKSEKKLISEKEKYSFVKVKFEEKKIEKIIQDLIEQEQYYFLSLKSKINEFKALLNNLNVKFYFANFSRGESGFFFESKIKEKSMCVPHGTISKYFDENDKIYKQNIHDSLVLNSNSYVALQSKITSEYFVNKGKVKNFFNSGNLIFSNSTKKKPTYLLYAVTNKDFNNIQYFGVETFYEHLENLKILNGLKTNYKVVVKVHPSEFDNIGSLKKIFPNLIFTKKKISKILERSILTISFSSSVIEDSINSKTPVILFDQWERYVHCKSEKDFSKKNEPIYYVNNEKSLKSCIETIEASKKINFNKVIFDKTVNENIKSIFSDLIK